MTSPTRVGKEVVSHQRIISRTHDEPLDSLPQF
jgi:hypothetical protein